MGHGLEIYDQQGVLRMNASTLVGRLIAIVDMNGASGSLNVPGLDQGVPFGIPMVAQGQAPWSGTHSFPVLTFNGTVVSWTRQTIAPITIPPCKVILGVR